MMRDQTGYSAVYTLQLRGTLVIVHVVYEFWIQWFVVRITFGNSKFILRRVTYYCRVYLRRITHSEIIITPRRAPTFGLSTLLCHRIHKHCDKFVDTLGIYMSVSI